MRDIFRIIREWWRKISLAIWFHPEFDVGRRMTVFGGAAFVAASVLSSHIKFAGDVMRGAMPAAGAIANELTSVVRRAFIPRLYVQLWLDDPLMAELLKTA